MFTRLELIKIYLILIYFLIQVTFLETSVFAQTEIKLDISEPKGQFGSSVSIDKDRAVVSNPGYRSAHVFKRERANWVEEAKLIPSDNSAFEHSVSISGDYILVTKGDGYTPGKAYVFHREGSNWIEQAILSGSDVVLGDQFGISGSIDGNRGIIGAHFDDDNGFQSGSAYVFRRDGSAWIEEAKLLASDGAETDVFGWSVSISGERIAVGAMDDDDKGYNTGSVYIFHREGSTWNEEAKLTGSDCQVWDNFGSSVFIRGSQLIVGAYQIQTSGPGTAYIYRFDGTNWIQEAKLIAHDGEIGDGFGCSASIDDDRAVIGAFNDDDKGERSGATYIFRQEGSNWVEEFKLVASDGEALDLYGYSVDINGDNAIIGTLYQSPRIGGAAYIYTLTLPIITAITDIPDDQGKQVRVSWMKSGKDGMKVGESTVVEYSLWRRINKLTTNLNSCSKKSDIVHIANPQHKTGSIVSNANLSLIRSSLPPGEWDFILTMPAIGSNTYNVVVPTLADSTPAHGMHWSCFAVIAHTANPLIFYVSAPDSGYSLDNLIPSTPKGLLASIMNNRIAINWQMVTDEDFNYYAIYRSTQSGFDPNTLEPYVTTTDTFFTDTAAELNKNYYYRVSAFDFSGNEGEFSDEISAIVTGLKDRTSVPIKYELLLNFPNPFNASTFICYSLPTTQWVNLKVFDMIGQEVITIVDANQEAGTYTVNFETRHLPSGVYFYKLQAGNYCEVKKMILMR